MRSQTGKGIALALVGWYLMVPPIKCCSRDPSSPDYDLLCGDTKEEGGTAVVMNKCGADKSASLSSWETKHVYDTAIECNGAAAKTIVRTIFGDAIQAQCIATDDPRLKGN